MTQTPVRDTGEAPRESPQASEDAGEAPVQDDLVEIRWHGRGGQGVVTGSELLAEAALLEGRYFQAFPEFGAERTGAPVRAFTRLSSQPIYLHCPVLRPGVVVVLDPTLLAVIDVFEGLGQHGVALINTPLSPEQVTPRPAEGARLYTVDATRAALDCLGRNIPNTAMLGALTRVAPVVSSQACVQVVQRRLGARFPARTVEANLTAFWRAYSEVKGATA